MLGKKGFHSQVITYALLFIYSLFIIAPVYIVLVSSFRTSEDVFKYMTPFTWRTLVPMKINFDAYVDIFKEINFGRSLFNSFFISIMSVIGGVVVNSMAGFAFAHLKFKGRDILFVMVLVTFMIPFESIAIPLYNFIRQLGLVNTYTGLILPGIANGMIIFLFRQFFKGFPKALFESARIDGASWFTIFYKIVLPISKPVIVSASILMLILRWNEFFYPLLVGNSPEYRVVQVAISNFFTQYQTKWNLLFAGVIMAAIIPILILLPLQRFFVQAVTGTGIKE
jgi:multiple sugar transport system permease protein/putative chitobiose transport system permease protein